MLQVCSKSQFASVQIKVVDIILFYKKQKHKNIFYGPIFLNEKYKKGIQVGSMLQEKKQR